MKQVVSVRDLEEMLRKGEALEDLPPDALLTPSARDFLRDLEGNGASKSPASFGNRQSASPSKPVTSKSAKGEIEAKSSQSLVVQQGRLLAGEALKYGVAMNPTCLAPPHSHFARVLPQSTWGRVKNFLLFRVIEPYWPFWPSEDAPTRTATR